MAYRKKTLRIMSPTARKVARLIGELDSISRRLKNLIPQLQRLDLDSKALAHAKQPADCSMECRYCEHLKDASSPHEKYIGLCEFRLQPDTCGKFELAKFYEGHDPRG